MYIIFNRGQTLLLHAQGQHSGLIILWGQTIMEVLIDIKHTKSQPRGKDAQTFNTFFSYGD
jgi:hypothetical protein